MQREYLEELVNKGLSTHDISRCSGKSQTTVRYHLKKLGLKTIWYEFQKKEMFGTRAICKKHGLTEYSKDKSCLKCGVEAVQKRRDDIKKKAVEYKGGKCIKCGYDRYIGALDFHHINPLLKTFSIGYKGYTRSWEKVKEELDKCDILCANCHRELHAKGVLA